MRLRLALPSAALLVLATACGGGDDATDDAGAAAPTTSAPGSSSGGAPAGGEVLLASVGLPDDPEAFEIALTTEDGEPVEELSPGSYEIRVTDPSRIHNFALTGPGVEMATSVSGTEETTWQVTLEEGDYDFVCDPHPSMSGSFTVA